MTSRTELVERIEAEGYELDEVEGSGSGGYVTIEDLESFIEANIEAEEELEEDLEEEIVVETSLADFDSGVREEPVEEELEEEVSPESAGVPEREFELEGAYVIDAEEAEKVLTKFQFRRHNSNELIVYTGQSSRQHSLVMNIAANALKEGGLFYVPEELSEYAVLDRLEVAEEAETVSGFVAFIKN